MIGLAVLFVSAVAIQTSAGDSLRSLAAGGSDSALALEVRARPMDAREGVHLALERAARARQPPLRDAEIAAARRLASAYALAWNDSFPAQLVARFASWPPARQLAKIRGDSVRRVGIEVYQRAGARAGIAVWRRALARSRAARDTAGMAAVLGNIGTAFLSEERADSAAAYFAHARRLAASIGDARVQANAVVGLAEVSSLNGAVARAREEYTRALGLFERIGDRRGMASTYNNIGLFAQDAGDLAAAQRHFESALELNQADGRVEVAATNLLNLAGLASLRGDFGSAARWYREALGIWRAREQWVDAALALWGLGQIELRRGDYPRARDALLEALRIRESTGPVEETLSIRRELARTLAAMGALQQAVNMLRTAERTADSARVGAEYRADLAVSLAELAYQLNNLNEAERYYSRAEVLYRQAGAADGEADALQGRALLLLERDDAPAARAALAAAERKQTAAGAQRAVAVTRILLARASLSGGDTVVARRELTRAAVRLDRLGDPVSAAIALTELAAIAAGARQPRMADSLYRAALARLRGRVAPDVEWQAHAGLAAALRSQGATAAALDHWRAALAVIEPAARSLRLPERRSTFLADKWEVYAQLAMAERDRGDLPNAFEASERMRAREMLETLSRGRVSAPSDTAAELTARAQDLRRRIDELTRVLAGANAANERLRGPDLPEARTTRQALLAAQEEYAALLIEMRERAPDQSTLLEPRTTGWRTVAARLAPNEAMIEYLVSDSSALAFIIVRDSLAAVPLHIDRQSLARLIDFARGTLAPQGTERVDSLWRGPLRRLHQALVAPVEQTGLLARKVRLVLVPHAELQYLPFAALIDGAGRFLVERYELSVAPSASTWLALGNRQRRRGSGTLALAPRPDVLPASRLEVGAIARLHGTRASVLSSAAATEAAFRNLGSQQQVVHLATYGILNSQNPLFSFVELTPGDGHDGRLEVHEVFGMRLHADLVVLSACQTALASGAIADVPAGDDWVGLTRAFLHAGAARVLATLWAVEDRATATLMERFYSVYEPGGDAVRALAHSQRALLASGESAHPFFWAGFVLVGGAEAVR